jgi:2Fe-2S ferredoxin
MPRVAFVVEGKRIEVDASPGETILDVAIRSDVKMGHACGGVCACSTCHCWVKKGLASLSEQEDREADILDKAFDVKPTSRLGCQSELDDEDVEVEITPESLDAWYDEHPVERKAAIERGEYK